MKNTTIYIKNMVCNRCIRVVREDLEKLGIAIDSIELGKAVISGDVSEEALMQIEKALLSSGFELINDRQHQIIEQIKTIIIEYIHHDKSKPESINLSDFLEQQVRVNYFSLSKLFSSVEGITIEKYAILQKIERVKELLVYDELSLGEIAFELGYSSVAHLSGQFKQVTGLTPTAFKKMTGSRRNPLDQIQDTK